MKRKNNQRKYLQHLGLSTLVVGSALTGYTLTSFASEVDDNINVTDVETVENTIDAVIPSQGRGGGGRGGNGGFGGDGGHGGGNHHNQTLSEDAFDPTDLVTIMPNVSGTPSVELVPSTEETPVADVTAEAEDASADTTDAEDTTADTTDDAEDTAAATEEAETTVVDGIYANGQYVGDSISADRWGNMQVVVVVEDNEISEVLIADYPRNTTLSDVISRNAMPTLISEAIAAQDADIDIVTGATDTSVAFIASLESAVDDALIIQG